MTWCGAIHRGVRVKAALPDVVDDAQRADIAFRRMSMAGRTNFPNSDETLCEALYISAPAYNDGGEKWRSR